MGGRAAIAAGLVAGVLTGGMALGGIILLTPGPIGPIVPAVSAPPASASQAPGTAGPSPAGSPDASSSSSPVASPSATALPLASGGKTSFGVGAPAPSLSVPQLGGGRIDLATLRGKPVWVNFMATWCPPCRDELPLMAGFAARYSTTGLVVIAIDVQEDEATVQAFAKAIGVTFPVGLDADGKAQGTWGAYALPVHFWIGADGVVRDGALGGIGPDLMAAGLKTILPGVNVTP